MNKLLLGFDVMAYNGEMPNCLDPKFLSTIHQASDFDYRFSGEGFKKRWNEDWSIYNSGFWDNHSIKKSIYEIIKYHPNEKWFYMIEPFGNIEAFFGNHPFYNKLSLENISSVALNEIKNGNGNLLINYIVDGGLGVTTNNFKKIIDFTRNNDIPDEKVYHSLRERQGALIDDADAYLVLPGGVGTMHELFQVLCENDVEKKERPILIYDPDLVYAPLEELLSRMHQSGYLASPARIHFFRSEKELSTSLGQIFSR